MSFALNFNNKPSEHDYGFEVFTGVVKDGQIWSETRVRGGGSGVSINGFGVGSSKTTSTVTNIREVCVEDESGLQEIFRFNAEQVPVAIGQYLSIVRTRYTGQHKSHTARPINIAVINHSMRRTQILRNSFTSLNISYGIISGIGVLVNIVVLLQMFGGNFSLAPLLLGNLWYLRLSQLNKPWRAQLHGMISEIGGEAPAEWAAKNWTAMDYARS